MPVNLAILSEPFSIDEVKWKPQVIRDGRGLPVCYVDARVVMDRLDEAFGVAGWSDSYEELTSGCVKCTITINVDGAVCYKTDVGGESEQPDESDRKKSAFSDALKRAAVKLGIGRYLYGVKAGWEEIDPKSKKFVRSNQELNEKYILSIADNLQNRQKKQGTSPSTDPSNLKSKNELTPREKREACAAFLKKIGIYSVMFPNGKSIHDLSEEEYNEVAEQARNIARSPQS